MSDFLAALEIVEPNPLPVEHLSASSLTMYARCREQWRARYIAGRKEPPKGYLVWGSADSAAAEHNYRQKIDSHADVPVDEVREVFAAKVDAMVDELGGESQIDWGDSGSADVKDSGTKLAAVYHEQVAPTVQPVDCEHKIVVPVPGVPVPLIGYLDVETDGAIIERKTAARKWTGGAPSGNYQMQAMIYQLAAPKPVHWHLSTKTKLPAVYTPAVEAAMEMPYSKARNALTERWVQAMVRSILSDVETFGSEGPWPGARAVMNSPCGFCGYKHNCDWWRD